MALQTVLIKPASGLCNMHCDYCFYCDEIAKRETESYGMMSEETIRKVIRKVLFQAEGSVCFAFQGGEPTLRGIEFYRKVLEFEQRFNRNGVQVMNTLQTNGLETNEDWCRFFHDNDFLIGVSLDGTKVLHDRYRHDRGGEPTYERVRETIRMFEKHGVEYNILTVVNRQTAEAIREIYSEYKKNGWRYQQYIACLDPLGEQWGGREYSLTPEEYGKFMTGLFDLWYKDWRRERAPYIRQFENYIGILMGYPPEACEQSGVCSVQCVTEADGSVYPCDFYAVDEYRLGNFNDGGIADFFVEETAKRFVQESKKISRVCLECPHYALCRGGCRRSRVREEDTDTYRSYFCEGYRMFFDKCGKRMAEIAEYLKKMP